MHKILRFFNDELIMGGYLSTIFLSIILFSQSIKNWLIYLVLLTLFLYILIMITGERSATLTISLTLIFTLVQYKKNIKIKLLSFGFLTLITVVMIILNPHIKGRYIDFFNHDLKNINNLSIYEKVATTPWGLLCSKIIKINH